MGGQYLVSCTYIWTLQWLEKCHRTLGSITNNLREKEVYNQLSEKVKYPATIFTSQTLESGWNGSSFFPCWWYGGCFVVCAGESQSSAAWGDHTGPPLLHSDWPKLCQQGEDVSINTCPWGWMKSTTGVTKVQSNLVNMNSRGPSKMLILKGISL